MFYLIDNAFARGYDHILQDGPREDFGLTYQSELYRIFAVADGHGDSNCPRSHIGSEYACNIAIDALKQFSQDIADNHLEALLLGKEEQKYAKSLISTIVSKWNDAVNADYNAKPLTPEEEAKCNRYLEWYKKGEKIEHIYGTTLIAGLLTDKYLLLLQQGDGRCDVFFSDGHVEQPIPWDERCIANVVTSLCDTDVAESFRFHIIDLEKQPIVACIADTDGVEDSFASIELLQNYHRSLLIYACENGIESLHEHLKETLPVLTETRSRDDITICGFVDIQNIANLISVFKLTNKRIDLQSELIDTESRLKSMESMGKMAALQADFEKACLDVAQLENEIEIVKKDRSALYSKFELLSNALQKTVDDKTNKEEEFLAYRKRKEDLLQEKEDILRQISDLDSESTETKIETTDDELKPEIKVDGPVALVYDEDPMPKEPFDESSPEPDSDKRDPYDG